MSKWVIAAKRADFNAISNKYHISPILARIIRNRDVITDDEIDMYLNGDIDNLHDPILMTDMIKAASLITQYISDGLKIRVIGDYDIDGICATYILIRGLRACGADVDYAIPHRIIDGYGLNEALIRSAHDAGRQVIITCDNGISASSQIEYANSLGMHVIVTDHHEIPMEDDVEIFPPAEAVVDPHRIGDNYPFAGICGAVVAWKLVQILMPMCNVSFDASDSIWHELLEEAAIATVGDVMELRDENRVIVKNGLSRLSNTSNIGLKALILATGLSGRTLSAYHIGFIIGPCLNATGRLDTASRALELLLCNDEDKAARMAEELCELNDARKGLTEQGISRAISDIEENESMLANKVLVAYLPDSYEQKGIMEGIIGIIAGRLRERYEKPVIVFTDAAGEEDIIKGSGRSIDNYNMFEELTKCKDLFTKYGGHKMAAGLSMSIDNLDVFRARINDLCSLSDEELVTKTVIDLELPFEYAQENLINELAILEPFGNGNTKPVFALRGLTVASTQLLGKNRNLLIIKAIDSGGTHRELKLFNRIDEFISILESGNSKVIDILYYPSINEYRGRRSVEYILSDYRFK